MFFSEDGSERVNREGLIVFSIVQFEHAVLPLPWL